LASLIADPPSKPLPSEKKLDSKTTEKIWSCLTSIGLSYFICAFFRPFFLPFFFDFFFSTTAGFEALSFSVMVVGSSAKGTNFSCASSLAADWLGSVLFDVEQPVMAMTNESAMKAVDSLTADLLVLVENSIPLIAHGKSINSRHALSFDKNFLRLSE